MTFNDKVSKHLDYRPSRLDAINKLRFRSDYSRGSRVATSTVFSDFLLVQRRHLEVIVGGKVLKEVALLLHDAVELVKVDLTIAITVGLVDHVLELLVIDVLTELLSHAGEVAEGDLVGVVVIEELEHL